MQHETLEDGVGEGRFTEVGVCHGSTGSWLATIIERAATRSSIAIAVGLAACCSSFLQRR